MKKRVIFFLGSVICFSVIIGMIGFVKNKSSTGNGQVTTEEVSSSVVAETATDMAASASDKDEEQQFFEQAVENKEKVEQDGSVFSKGSYQIYNGFGFTVTYFHVYDTYEEFVESEHYNSDYVETDPKDSKWITEEFDNGANFVYAEIEVTNEDRYEKEFLPTMCEIVCTQDDYIAYVDGKSFYGYAYNDFYMSKRDGWEEIQGAEIEKLARYYQIRPGETVTIAIGGTSYVECYTEGDGNGEDPYEFIGEKSVDEVFTSPKYYLEIAGDMPSSGDQAWQEKNIRDALTHIYIECQ